MHDENARKIILSANLKGFFFEGLTELNRKSLCPVPESVIFYSSDVLDKFALSQDYFEVSEGKVRQKILGTKLLEATQLNRDEQKKVYKEVADMSLLVCGYFSQSVNKKIVDKDYYAQLGKMAYGHLNSMSPTFLDIPSFYQMVATCFESLTTLMAILATNSRQEQTNLIIQRLMKDEPLDEKEMMIAGILKPTTCKVS